jgi:hypothetical protein
MDIARKIGIGIVMIIPTFVGAGAIWGMIHSWFAIVVWVVIMGLVTGSVIRGNLSRALRAEP